LDAGKGFMQKKARHWEGEGLIYTKLQIRKGMRKKGKRGSRCRKNFPSSKIVIVGFLGGSEDRGVETSETFQDKLPHTPGKSQ